MLECPICYEKKTLVSKFQCNQHKICNKCFINHLEKSVNINCPICRVEIDDSLLLIEEKIIIQNKDHVTDYEQPSLVSQLNFEPEECPEWMLQNFISLTNKSIHDIINL